MSLADATDAEIAARKARVIEHYSTCEHKLLLAANCPVHGRAATSAKPRFVPSTRGEGKPL